MHICRMVKVAHQCGLLWGDYFGVGQRSTTELINELTDNEELRSVLLYMVPAIGACARAVQSVQFASWHNIAQDFSLTAPGSLRRKCGCTI